MGVGEGVEDEGVEVAVDDAWGVPMIRRPAAPAAAATINAIAATISQRFFMTPLDPFRHQPHHHGLQCQLRSDVELQQLLPRLLDDTDPP